MPKLSYGLNLTRSPASITSKPAATGWKTIFDDDSGLEDGPDGSEDHREAISTLGELQSSSSTPGQPIRSTSTVGAASQAAEASRVAQLRDLSTNHTTSKHAQTAQSLDPSIYDYDAVYDSLHSRPKSSESASAAADEAKKPRYMKNLLAAAETRKRDQLRAREKMLTKERELEGDEFAEKEKFVTAAYKRQQEEMRKAEAEEALREQEAAERQRREGGGLKGMYKNMLERDEEKHATALKSVAEAKRDGTLGQEKAKGKDQGRKEKTEAELAREKGAVVNEEGQVVDKRQLLSAGLNAGAAPRARVPAPAMESRSSGQLKTSHYGHSGRVTRAFKDQPLGKRGAESEGEDDTGGRASKSRKMEDDILASLGL
ncbi:MAG: hypothetical protein LQ348_001227 [Seirophora lacunosa]|nr:MAG: hypothetical protein LQ348_001227 [Seirophora lacunosa]